MDTYYDDALDAILSQGCAQIVGPNVMYRLQRHEDGRDVYLFGETHEEWMTGAGSTSRGASFPKIHAVLAGLRSQRCDILLEYADDPAANKDPSTASKFEILGDRQMIGHIAKELAAELASHDGNALKVYAVDPRLSKMDDAILNDFRLATLDLMVTPTGGDIAAPSGPVPTYAAIKRIMSWERSVIFDRVKAWIHHHVDGVDARDTDILNGAIETSVLHVLNTLGRRPISETESLGIVMKRNAAGNIGSALVDAMILRRICARDGAERCVVYAGNAHVAKCLDVMTSRLGFRVVEHCRQIGRDADGTVYNVRLPLFGDVAMVRGDVYLYQLMFNARSGNDHRYIAQSLLGKAHGVTSGWPLRTVLSSEGAWGYGVTVIDAAAMGMGHRIQPEGGDATTLPDMNTCNQVARLLHNSVVAVASPPPEDTDALLQLPWWFMYLTAHMLPLADAWSGCPALVPSDTGVKLFHMAMVTGTLDGVDWLQAVTSAATGVPCVPLPEARQRMLRRHLGRILSDTSLREEHRVCDAVSLMLDAMTVAADKMVPHVFPLDTMTDFSVCLGGALLGVPGTEPTLWALDRELTLYLVNLAVSYAAWLGLPTSMGCLALTMGWTTKDAPSSPSPETACVDTVLFAVTYHRDREGSDDSVMTRVTRIREAIGAAYRQYQMPPVGYRMALDKRVASYMSSLYTVFAGVGPLARDEQIGEWTSEEVIAAANAVRGDDPMCTIVDHDKSMVTCYEVRPVPMSRYKTLEAVDILERVDMESRDGGVCCRYTSRFANYAHRICRRLTDAGERDMHAELSLITRHQGVSGVFLRDFLEYSFLDIARLAHAVLDMFIIYIYFVETDFDYGHVMLARSSPAPSADDVDMEQSVTFKLTRTPMLDYLRHAPLKSAFAFERAIRHVLSRHAGRIFHLYDRDTDLCSASNNVDRLYELLTVDEQCKLMPDMDRQVVANVHVHSDGRYLLPMDGLTERPVRATPRLAVTDISFDTEEWVSNLQSADLKTMQGIKNAFHDIVLPAARARGLIA